MCVSANYLRQLTAPVSCTRKLRLSPVWPQPRPTTGCMPTTTAAPRSKRGRPKVNRGYLVPEDAINGQVLVKWIKTHAEEDPYRGLLVNRVAMKPSLQRAYFRWRKEDVNPRFDTAERALRDLGASFREFEEWAQDHNLSVWVSGKAPSWWTDESNSRLLEDLDSTDPLWIREARIEGIELGVLDKLGRRPRRISRLRASKISGDKSQLVAAKRF